MNSKPKQIKGWAYMADDSRKGKYFITDSDGKTEIFLKKPPAGINPFTGKKTWKPTPFIILLPKKRK